MSFRKYLLVAAIFAAPFAHSDTTGFTSADAQKFSQAASEARGNLVDLKAAATKLRAALMVDPVANVRGLPAFDRAVIEKSFGGVDATSAAHISWFFRAAQMQVVPGELVHQVSWYNPIIDVVLITNWRRIDRAWHPVASIFADAADYRREGLRGVWFTDASKSYQKSFADRTQASLQALDRRVNAPPTSAGLQLLVQRSSLIQKGLGETMSQTSRSTAVGAIRSGLADGTLAEAMPGSSLRSANIENLPQMLRASFDVLAIFRRRESSATGAAPANTLVLESATQPTLVVFVDTDANLKPLDASVVNLLANPNAGEVK